MAPFLLLWKYRTAEFSKRGGGMQRCWNRGQPPPLPLAHTRGVAGRRRQTCFTPPSLADMGEWWFKAGSIPSSCMCSHGMKTLMGFQEECQSSSSNKPCYSENCSKCQSCCSVPGWTNTCFSLNSSLGNLLWCVATIRHYWLKSASCIPGYYWSKSTLCKSFHWLRSVTTDLYNSSNLLAPHLIFFYTPSQGDQVT